MKYWICLGLLTVNVAFALILNTIEHSKTIHKRSLIKAKTRCGSSAKFVNYDKDDDDDGIVKFSRTIENKLVGLYTAGKLCEKINFVLYNFKLSLARLILKSNVEGAEVKSMKQAGLAWKWPEKDDTLYYFKEDIICDIREPVLKNNRGSYNVKEMNKYL